MTDRMAHTITQGVLIAFCLLLVLLPLPFGANRMWSANLFALLAGLMLAAYGACLALRPDLSTARITPPVKLAAILAGIVVIWAVLQFTGLTPGGMHHPLWAETQAVLAHGGYEGSVDSAIAVDPAAGYKTLVRFLGYVACFWLAYFLSSAGDGARLILRVVIIAALLYAVYGLVLEALGLRQILWFPKVSYVDNLTSTFINRNSYASYAGMGLICAAAYVARRWRMAFDRFDRHAWWRDFLQVFVVRELVFAALPLVIFASLLLAESRAGFASAMIGLMVFGFAFAINQHMRAWKLAIMLAAIIGILAGLFVIGGSGLNARLHNTQVADDTEARLVVYDRTAGAIESNPLIGFGWGNFDSAFRMFRDEAVHGWFHKAHSDWLETPLDLGIPMAALLMLAFGLLVWRCAVGVFKRRRDGIFPAIGLASSAMLCVHSVVDFPLQIPAIAATYAVLLGMGVAQSYSSRL
ncbi:MAG: hypothetical protein GC131_05735 [Alphaproteobacteria bacterium]|nr:hypothetical protein [Alphaproteobacteria bacterium]